LERQIEEQLLAGPALVDLLLDGSVVVRAVLDRVVEDGRVRRESRDREVVDVARQRAVLQEVASDVVEPDALALVVQRRRAFHAVISRERVKDPEGAAGSTGRGRAEARVRSRGDAQAGGGAGAPRRAHGQYA